MRSAARRLDRNGPVRLKRYGREAAFEEAGELQHCRDLAGKFARESARRTTDPISDVRDRYELIVEELLPPCVMCNRTDDATR